MDFSLVFIGTIVLPKKGAMALLQDIFIGATQGAKDASRFYDENYSSIAQWILEPAKKVILRSSQTGICRFCDLRIPNVTFKNEAHAIPECLGNRSLTTDYECDGCNRFFGTGIENDFGNWSKPQRTVSRIRGKKGVPTLKKGSSGGWRIEHGPAGLEVTQYEDDPVAIVNEAAHEIVLTLRRDPYTPVAVLKAFAKMALSLLPEEELPNFRAAMAWIRNTDHQVGLVANTFPVLHSFVPGDDPFVSIAAILLRRRADHLRVPYLTFVLTYGNEVFQTVLPSPERDTAISNQKIKFRYFPTPYELLEPVAPMRRELIDLTGRSPVVGETIQTVMSYELSPRDEREGLVRRGS